MRVFAAGFVALVVALFTGGVKPAEATVPFALSITGPSSVVAGTQYAYSGKVTIGSLVGVGNLTIKLEVNGAPAGSTTSARNGTYSKKLTFAASPTTQYVRALAFKGSVLQTRSPVIAVTVSVPTYVLTVSTLGEGTGIATSSPAGIDCGATCSASFPASSVVSLSATPSSGSVFTGWSGACTGNGACNVTMSSAKSVDAVFSIETKQLEVRILNGNEGGNGGAGGTVTRTPGGTGSPCTGQCFSSHPTGTAFTFVATPNPGSVFTGWGDACSGTGSCGFTMSQDRRVTATFVKYVLAVTFAGNGGTNNVQVTSSPAGINCFSSCPAQFDAGQVVTLTATAGVGRTFTGWSGGGCSGTGTCVVTMDANKDVTATFTLITYTLTITKSGVGNGTVTSSPAGINCGATCAYTFNYGANVALTATPDGSSAFGPAPAGWSGSGCFGQTPTCGVVMDGDKTVNANFGLASP